MEEAGYIGNLSHKVEAQVERSAIRRQNLRGFEQNKRRSRSRPVQTVLQQMLPFGIERLRRYDLCRSFLSRYRAVPGCDADRERKNGAKN